MFCRQRVPKCLQLAEVASPQQAAYQILENKIPKAGRLRSSKKWDGRSCTIGVQHSNEHGGQIVRLECPSSLDFARKFQRHIEFRLIVFAAAFLLSAGAASFLPFRFLLIELVLTGFIPGKKASVIGAEANKVARSPIDPSKLEKQAAMARTPVAITKQQGENFFPRVGRRELDILHERLFHGLVSLNCVRTLEK
jgi:hypothetical protein